MPPAPEGGGGAAPPAPKAIGRLEALLERRAAEDGERTGRATWEQEKAAWEQQRQQQQAQYAQAMQAIEEERQRFARWRADPVGGARELGHDPDKVAAELMRAGSPEAVWEKRIADLEAKIAGAAKPVEEKLKTLEERWQQAEQQATRQQIERVEKEFVAAASPEAFPHVRAFYETPEELVEAGYKVLKAVQAKGGTCTDRDILEYLESKAAKRVAALRGSAAATGAPEGADKGNAAQSQSAKGPRTLSAKGASERLSTSTLDIRDMSPADEDEALTRVVRAAKKKR